MNPLSNIQNLLERGKINECLDSLLNPGHNVPRGKIIKLKARFVKLKEDLQKGVISRDSYHIAQNQIIDSLTDIVLEIEKKESDKKIPILRERSSSTYIKRLLIVFLVLILIFLGGVKLYKRSPPIVNGLEFKGENSKGFFEYKLKKEPFIELIYIPFDESNPDLFKGNKGFFISKYEVSKKEYEFFKHANKNTVTHSDSLYPVVSISWYDAIDYCDSLSNRFSLLFTLPSESMWEYAARGNYNYEHPWGDSSFYQNGIYYANSAGAITSEENHSDPDRYEDVAPTHSFENGISPFGVFNMLGNVEEWTSCTLNMNPMSMYAIIKGGSYLSKQNVLKIENSTPIKKESCYSHIGLRIIASFKN